jgi:hypothetical protein
MRHYVEPVEVRRGRIGDVEGPAQFLWRHRLYLVRDVLACWVEASSWWRTGDDGCCEREVWRVEAGRGRQHPPVVADLAHSAQDGRWLLLRTYD